MKMCKTTAGKVTLVLAVLAAAGAAYYWHTHRQDDDQKAQPATALPQVLLPASIPESGAVATSTDGTLVSTADPVITAASAGETGNPAPWLPPVLLSTFALYDRSYIAGRRPIYIDDPRLLLWTM